MKMKKKTLLLIILIIIVLCVSILYKHSSAPTAQKKGPSVLVQTIQLKKKTLSDTISVYGSLLTDPSQNQNISLPISTIIQHFFVGPGQLVKKGQPLFDFLPDLSVQLSYQQAQNNLSFAQKEAGRMLRLYNQQLATQSQLSAANKAVLDAQQALKSAESQGSTPTLKSINAPFDGIITQTTSTITNGSPVQSGSVLLQIGKCNAMMAQLNVDPNDIARVHQAMKAKIDILSNTASKTFSGIVKQVTYTIDPTTRLSSVWVSLPTLSCKIWPPGLPIKGKIILAQQMLWTVPASAVLRDETGDYIYRVVQNHAERISIVPVIYDGNEIGITGPLHPNDVIVISGNYELKNHMEIRRMAVRT